jgi:ubiquitin-protein ligase
MGWHPLIEQLEILIHLMACMSSPTKPSNGWSPLLEQLEILIHLMACMSSPTKTHELHS